MDYNRLIHDYLDNEISSTNEDVLFGELSRNFDLRMEFNNQLQLHLVAQNDIGTISTPIESTNMIFSTLGFSIPSNSSNFANSYNSFTNKYITKAIIGFATLLVATLSVFVMNYKIDNSNIGNNQISQIKENHFIVSNNINENSKNIAFVSSNYIDNLNQHRHNLKSENNLNQNNYKYSNNTNPIGTEENKFTKFGHNKDNNQIGNINDYNLNQENIKTISKADEIPLNLNNLNFSNINNDKFNTYVEYNTINFEEENNRIYSKNEYSKIGGFQNNVNFNSFYDAISVILPKDFNFKLNTISSKSLNQVNVNSYNSIFNNLALELSYNINENNTIGVEIGKEQFSQEFVRTIENYPYTFRQNPSLFWYGIKYTFNSPELMLFNSIIPYASIFGGGTVSGPIAKCQLGFNYYINSFVSINCSAEAARLFYNVESINYKSDKFGFNYGINIHY